MHNREKQSNHKGNNGGYARSAVKEGIGQAQKQTKEVPAQADQVITSVDKQLRENPWTVIAGVALGAFLLGCLFSKSNNE